MRSPGRPRRTLLLAALLVLAGCAGPRSGAWRGTGGPDVPGPSPEAVPAPTPTPPAVSPPAETPPAPTPAPETGSPPPAAGPTSGATPPPTAGPTAAATDQVRIQLARGVTDGGEAVEPGLEFPDTTERLYVVVEGAPVAVEDPNLFAHWKAVRVEGHEASADLGYVAARPGSRHARRTPRGWVLWFDGPYSGFAPGAYTVELRGPIQHTLAFTVTPATPQAGGPEAAAAARGLNVAAAALGGRIVSVTSEKDDASRSARTLIDGFPVIIDDPADCEPSCGWVSRERTADSVEAHRANFPQDIVFGFYQGRRATVHAVVIDTTSFQHWYPLPHKPRQVEVWVSTTSPTEGFTRVAAAWLPARMGEHLIAFPPTPAAFVRLRVLSNYGARAVHLAEVKILEVPEGPSILADLPKNIAHQALGGVVSRWSTLREHRRTAHLIDGDPATVWVSHDPAPVELVFAFQGDQVALVDRLVLTLPDEGTLASDEAWPRTVVVEATTETPVDGYEEVGRFSLRQASGDHTLPVNRRARFLRLRVTEAAEGRRVAIGEVRALEGTAPGYTSILLTTVQELERRAATVPPPVEDPAAAAVEQEVNNTPAQANPLVPGRRTKGTIDPLGEEDFFRLTVPAPADTVLTFEVAGQPAIRSSVTLQDPGGRTLASLTPRALPGRRAAFSWAVRPGDHLVRVTEPPASIVLVWDTSGSMDAASVANLKAAVEAYLEGVQPSERLNLIRFSGRAGQQDPPYVETLLPRFTSDPAALRAAARDKFFAKGGTPLYDAVRQAVVLLQQAEGNRAIVLMTDGVDTTSRLSYPDFWRLLERHRIRLYTIGLGRDLPVFDSVLGTSGRRLLAHAALATAARSFFTGDPEQLTQIYREIAEELRRPGPYYLRATLSRGPGTLAVSATGERLASVAAPGAIQLILDASGSMKRRIEGRPMMDIAKDVMVQIIKELPGDARVALRVYGHRIREGRPGDCQDSQLLVPFQRLDKPRMIARVRAIQALGTTPIAYTLRQVAQDLRGVPGEKLVILVTDGKEECGGSPSAVVADLVARGVQVRLNIVGFALADAATKEEMARVARLTGGRFFDARDARALTQAIRQSLAVPYQVRDARGTVLARGTTGQPVRVPEGIYTVVVQAAGEPITVRHVRVSYQAFTKVLLHKEGARVGVQVVGP